MVSNLNVKYIIYIVPVREVTLGCSSFVGIIIVVVIIITIRYLSISPSFCNVNWAIASSQALPFFNPRISIPVHALPVPMHNFPLRQPPTPNRDKKGQSVRLNTINVVNGQSRLKTAMTRYVPCLFEASRELSGSVRCTVRTKKAQVSNEVCSCRFAESRIEGGPHS
jgi:hypothetical protein